MPKELAIGTQRLALQALSAPLAQDCRSCALQDGTVKVPAQAARSRKSALKATTALQVQSSPSHAVLTMFAPKSLQVPALEA